MKGSYYSAWVYSTVDFAHDVYQVCAYASECCSKDKPWSGATGRRLRNNENKTFHISKRSGRHPVLVVNDGIFLSQIRDKMFEK